MGDDERFDYIYKFVSDDTLPEGRLEAAREHNKKPARRGHALRRQVHRRRPAEIDGTASSRDGEFDGTGKWIPLVVRRQVVRPRHVRRRGLIFTRLAADKVGATKMDRPEDVEPTR